LNKHIGKERKYMKPLNNYCIDLGRSWAKAHTVTVAVQGTLPYFFISNVHKKYNIS